MLQVIGGYLEYTKNWRTNNEPTYSGWRHDHPRGSMGGWRNEDDAAFGSGYLYYKLTGNIRGEAEEDVGGRGYWRTSICRVFQNRWMAFVNIQTGSSITKYDKDDGFFFKKKYIFFQKFKN